MLRRTNDLKGYTLRVEDDAFGRLAGFLFDDHLWIVRYMVA
jgi:hypothetical protein